MVTKSLRGGRLDGVDPESCRPCQTRLTAGLEVDENLVGVRSVLPLGVKAGPEVDDGVRRVVLNSDNSWTRSRREPCRSPESPQTLLRLDQKSTMESGESFRTRIIAGLEVDENLVGVRRNFAKVGPEVDDGVRRVVPNSDNSWTRRLTRTLSESGESFRTRIIAGLEVDENLVGVRRVLKLC